MEYLLHIETATKNCSVAISSFGKLIVLKEVSSINYSHSENLHVFINSVLKDVKIEPKDLSAVSISKGPGSYTGLRIGVASAKGLCYALDIPLIAINSLEIMAQKFKAQPDQLIVPMIDARRDEVYTMVFDHKKKVVKDTWAEILNRESFIDISENKTCIFFGDGSFKFKDISPKVKSVFIDEVCYPSAREMISISYKKFKNKIFESVAYFEPYYLKEFITTPPKKK
jgi:tRNA threonylcarbamoyladenosine biosynthesis protein TsaB